MRFVFIGSGARNVLAARILLDRGHEVVIVELDRERIDLLSDDLDCSFLHGDGSDPQILREAGPDSTDVLFCGTSDDKVNVLSALMGRSLGFEKVVPSIRSPDLEGLCRELGLENTIIPDRTIARYVADMACGIDILELSTIVKGEARFFSFAATEEDAGPVSDLDLPEQARVVYLVRDDEFRLADGDTALREGDDVVLVAHSSELDELQERWPKRTG